MQVKIFESTDMASGLKLVKETLGPDALILSTRTIRNGKMGIMGKPVLEITAAIDSPWPSAAPQPRQAAPRLNSPPKKNFTQWADDTISAQKETPSGRSLTYDAGLRLHQHPEPDPPEQTVSYNELDELKEMVRKLGLEVSRLNKGQEKEARRRVQEGQQIQTGEEAIAQQSAEVEQDEEGRPEKVEDQLLHRLVKQGISAETAQEIVSIFASRELPPSESQGENDLERTLTDTIGDLIHVAPPLRPSRNKQHRIALVGPTGVGKTTTLAKIAAHYLGNFSNSIALITIDTYRIAAVEQLKVYGAIMNLPVEVVITPEQLDKALSRHRDKELILIDTAGRSPRDTLCIQELATFLRADHSIDKHLVLSATTRRSELFDIIERFSVLGIDNTIITKTDECNTLGVILDLQMHDQNDIIPLSWITNGQRVPEDLLPADPEIVTGLIIPPLPGDTGQSAAEFTSASREISVS